MIYQQYLRAYKKGVFNFIKEDVDSYSNETIPRKYFSGGEITWAAKFNAAQMTSNPAMAIEDIKKEGSTNFDDAQVNMGKPVTERMAVEKTSASMGTKAVSKLNKDLAMTNEEHADVITSKFLQWHTDAYTPETQEDYRSRITTKVLGIINLLPNRDETTFQKYLDLFDQNIVKPEITNEDDLDLGKWSVAYIFLIVVKNRVKIAGSDRSRDAGRSVEILSSIFKSTEGRDPLFRILYMRRFTELLAADTLRLSPGTRGGFYSSWGEIDRRSSSIL